MKETEKTRSTTGAKKAVSLTSSVLLAVSLPFGLMPLSAYAQTADDTGSDPAIAIVVEADESDGTGSPDVVVGEPEPDPAPATDEPAAPEPEDLAKVLGDEGAAAYEKWLKGEELSSDELFKINVDALRPLHPEEADAIAELQDAVRQAEEAAAAEASAELADGEDSESGSMQGGADAEEADASETADPSEQGGEAATDESKESKKADASAASKKVTVSNEQKPTESNQASDHPQWSYSGDTTYAPRDQNWNLTTTKLIALIGEPARQVAAENDLYASVMIAQAILESDSGNAKLAHAPQFNLFGMEGDYQGESVVLDEQEGTAFKSYPSYRESLADYAELLSGDDYKQTRKSRTDSYEEACDCLEGTYSTSKGYAKSLKDLIATYDLTRYDKSLDYELAQTYTVQVENASTDPSGQKQEASVEKRDLVDLISEASSHLGCPYVWGAEGPNAFDCSGMVGYSYAQALGVTLPRTSYWMCMEGEDVDFKDLHMGDLLFFTNSKGEVHHVAMYLAEGCYIESTTPGGVQVTALDERTPTFAKRMLKTASVKAEELSPAQTMSRNLRHQLMEGLSISYSIWGSDDSQSSDRIRVVELSL